MSVKTLGFIGLGLIGGSIVKTVKRIYPDIRIIARSGRQTTITQAFEVHSGTAESFLSLPIKDGNQTFLYFN